MPIVNPQTPTNNPPTSRALENSTPTNGAPAARAVGDLTPIDGAPMPVAGGENQPQINMPASFSPAFQGITGGGLALNALNVTAADSGKILQGVDANGALVSYRVKPGTDAQALPGIIRPANFHAATNAFVFVQL